ncbi:MAG: NAD-dependent epimerase/dehydratase family protein [Bacteroidia bacterium]|nr:NAD-dependent epimerase/dehydratase family protein [Bacteroidia bacterium]NNF30980.1 NAD-dependent epimerase/dehydratase family protein [Flavobacteriaceae bacterium]MBT8274942.1 NAD-dependent epimerase/dehydratase family protein [Bacteroidia bacterium]NNJ82625.1 NAD-dependent epimerase/dehydratase family protein [Flavobacteriaceae bacterium]NNK53133.1 NAD-dependent epimerase/dehydratase family protein [Flavobacteriaceae bacterium]
MKKRILIIGACGQIGTELTERLRRIYAPHKVIASDIHEGNETMMKSGPFEVLDAMDYESLENVVINHEISEVYLMAAMLSATAEKFPMKGWNLNMNSLFNVLNLAKEGKIEKVFWPSSIAVFGPTTPKVNTPQHTIAEPTTVYGISKLTGERWCEYYHKKFGVDVRSLRYPGLISYKTLPGGGTTDYAVEIYHKAVKHKKYISFLNKGTTLPMMFIDDAINATIGIMEAKPEEVKLRSSYNLAAISFDPEEIAASIKQHIPDFQIYYEPDFRQAIADSWPNSIDDTKAREDWGWSHTYDLKEMTEVMIENLQGSLLKASD